MGVQKKYQAGVQSGPVEVVNARIDKICHVKMVNFKDQNMPSTNTIQSHWLKDYTFISTNQDGQSIVTDSPTEKDGTSCAPSPMDVVLMGLAGCAGIDVKLILTKSKQQFTDIKVTTKAQRRDEIPRIYTDINLHFTVKGHELEEKHVARAIQLSAEKYCSVSHMLQGTVNVTHSYEIIND